METLTFIDDNNNIQTIDCFDAEGVSKGLKKIAIELGYDLPAKMKIEELKKILINLNATMHCKKCTIVREWRCVIIFYKASLPI